MDFSQELSLSFFSGAVGSNALWCEYRTRGKSEEWVSKSVPNIHMYVLISRHTICAGTQTQTCFNCSTLSTRGLCVQGWEMPCQHAPYESLEGRKRLNSIKMSMWWKMHGEERGTVAPCTHLSTKKLLRIFLSSLSTPTDSAASLTDYAHLITQTDIEIYTPFTVYINSPELNVCKPSDMVCIHTYIHQNIHTYIHQRRNSNCFKCSLKWPSNSIVY